MKQFLAVFRFTYLEAVRKKSFRVTTILLLVVSLAACRVPKLFGDTPSETDNAAYLPGEGETIYYLDETGAIPGGARRRLVPAEGQHKLHLLAAAGR